MIFSAWKR